MSRRSQLLVLSAVAGVALALVHAPSETRGQQARTQILPDLEMRVGPCCPASRQHFEPEWTPPSRDRVQTPPEGIPVDEETLRSMRSEARRFAPRGREMSSVAPVRTTPAASAPRPRKKFNALNFGQSGRFVPPDTQVAAGPAHVLQAVNAALLLANHRGRMRIRQSAAEHFGLDDDTMLFDPKLHYDPLSERFFLVFLERSLSPRRSFIRLSVSRGPRPRTLGDDDWCKYRIRSKVGVSWADYPGLGMNEDWLAVSTNNFRFRDESFLRSLFFVIDKAGAVDNEAGCPTIDVSRIRTRSDDDGRVVFNPQVAQHHTTSGLEGRPLFAVNTQFLSFSDRYVLWRIGAVADRQGGRERPAATREMVTAAEGYAFPPQAMQKGSDKPLDAGDVRVMQQLVFVDGQLWIVHGSGCTFDEATGAETFSCVRVTRIIPGEDSATVDFEDLFGVDEHYLFWPGIGVTRGGDVVAAFHMTGATKQLSTAYNGMPRGARLFGPITRLDDDDGFDSIRMLVNGRCPTELPRSGDVVRTGDYIGVSPDQRRNHMWISGEFAKRVSGECGWATQIARVSY